MKTSRRRLKRNHDSRSSVGKELPDLEVGRLGNHNLPNEDFAHYTLCICVCTYSQGTYQKKTPKAMIIADMIFTSN